MKAIVYENYGPPEVLQIKEVGKPTPKDHEILIKVHATTVTAAEGMMRRGDTFIGRMVLGIRKPKRKILGLELSGEIESVGKDVTRFKAGESVCGFTGMGAAAYAEYVCMPEKGSLMQKPGNLNFEEAVSLVDGASTALFFLMDKAHLQCGQKVLINGASGSIGTAAVQLAKHFGAEVTAVCSSANHEMVKHLGADKVIDYTKEDFTQNGETWDVIFDTVGKTSFSRCRKALTKNGRYLVTNGNMALNFFLTLWTSWFSRKKFIFAFSVEKNAGFQVIKKLVEEGKIKSVIDKIYPFDQIVEAHRYVEKGHKKGNVVIQVVKAA